MKGNSGGSFKIRHLEYESLLSVEILSSVQNAEVSELTGQSQGYDPGLRHPGHLWPLCIHSMHLWHFSSFLSFSLESWCFITQTRSSLRADTCFCILLCRTHSSPFVVTSQSSYSRTPAESFIQKALDVETLYMRGLVNGYWISMGINEGLDSRANEESVDEWINKRFWEIQCFS